MAAFGFEDIVEGADCGGEDVVEDQVVAVEDAVAGLGLRRGGLAGSGVGVEEVWGRRPLPLHYRALYLEKMDPEAFLAANPGLALAPALAALMKGGRWSPVRHKIECMRRIAETKAIDPLHRDLLVECVETYVDLDDEQTVEFEERWRKETGMALPEMTYTERLEMKAREAGREAGREEGREEGRTEGTRRILLLLLELRFGPLTEATRERVRELDSTRELESLAEQVLTASSLAEMDLA